MRIISEKDVYRCLDGNTTKDCVSIRDEIAARLKINPREISLESIYYRIDNLEDLGFVEESVIKVSGLRNSMQSHSEYKLTQKGLENRDKLGL